MSRLEHDEFLAKIQSAVIELPLLSCAVYLLKFKGEVVFVGQSVAVYGRIGNHMYECDHTRKDVDEICVIPCEREELQPLEHLCIKALNPKHNNRIKKRSFAISKSFLERHGITL